MMDFSTLTTNVGAGFEILIFVLQVLYVFFAFLLTRQAALMHRSFSTKASPLFTAAANIHLVGSVVLTLLSFLIVFK